ncbi:uncharacterized protein LOC129340975 [Eublepharis macularius]|uniref:Uncharacterized protein LOC129340975 n=1 Tax=Eublepharis macularius TaxID=481883 RepID=A0AA97LDZ2_EUBMA|nr:uncharacterized protein LOC129340975 [Eublepharis macularius]
MAWALVLLTVLSYYSGVSSQSPWSQPASESVSPGQTAKISCTTNSENYNIHWYQQKSGQAPRYVHYPGGSRGDGIPDRFTASVSGSMGYLTITNMQPEDEADYYCLKWYSSASQFHSANGSRVLVNQAIVEWVCAEWNSEAPWVCTFGCTLSQKGAFFSCKRIFLLSQKLLLTLTMAWALFLLTVLNFYSGITSVSPWSQPASASPSPGQTAKISCSTDSGSDTIFWYQQKSGQAPRYVHGAGYSRGDGIPERFTASASGSTGYLTITNIQPEDEADYYCAKWERSGSEIHSAENQTEPKKPSEIFQRLQQVLKIPPSGYLTFASIQVEGETDYYLVIKLLDSQMRNSDKCLGWRKLQHEWTCSPSSGVAVDHVVPMIPGIAVYGGQKGTPSFLYTSKKAG